MSNFKVNISADDVLSQRETELAKKVVTTFNINNYLQARLGENETSKDITIRLLPFTPEGGSPFHKIYMHQIKVNKEVSSSGWKKLPCPIKNKLGTACPFCETNESAKNLKKTTNIEAEKKAYEEIEIENYAKPMWLVRCIERGKEDEGVKFWLFSDSKQKDGVYDKIYAIFKKRLEKGKNIFDVNEGKDLCLSLSKDSNGRTRIAITDDDDLTPLTDDYELGNSWINDSKLWTDVYKVKPYDYMKILVNSGIPVFDKVQQKYVNKNDLVKDTQQQVSKEMDRSEYTTPIEAKVYSVSSQVDDEEDDLPF